MESLANNHPFIDGNKRVAFASAHTFLLLNGFDLVVESEPAFTFVMKSFDQQRFKYAEILEWINKNIVQIRK
jgi:death-on-curing protein